MKYKNWKGEDIDTDSVSDERLVALYKFLLAYSKHIIDATHKQEIDSIKDSIKVEIKTRGLKMKNYI